MIRRRRAIGLRRDRGQRPDAGAVGQPGEDFGGQRGQGIRTGIDPGRQIDEWFGCARKHAPRGVELAAVGERLQR